MKNQDASSTKEEKEMSKIDIVITMGGLGSRFRDAGYDMPKYMITAKGKTLFEWSLISLDGFKDIASTYIFIALKDEAFNVEAFINQKCVELGIHNYHVILLDFLTDGQATTALLSEKYWTSDHGLLIYNIDTYVESGEMNSSQLKGDGFIPCFYGEGDHWSFVKLDKNDKAIEVKEKMRISDNCTLGAYYFKTCRLYKKLYEEFYVQSENLVKGEKYIAPLYNYLILKGGNVFISIVPRNKVHVLGTPNELNIFLNS